MQEFGNVTRHQYDHGINVLLYEVLIIDVTCIILPDDSINQRLDHLFIYNIF